jgi:alkylated DNA nucleotide flippase Atl1
MLSNNGSILHLFIKYKQGSELRQVDELSLKEGYGIAEDINANPISPRQVLVVRHEDIIELAISAGELRENIVIAGITSDNFSSGSLITFDGGAAIRLTFHCEPCKRIAHLVDSLKTLQYKRGMLGVIIKSGLIRVGNNFQIQPAQFPVLSENPYERFLDFIVKVPPGKIVTYKHILTAIGVDKSYMRAIPTYLKKTSADNYPIHRILDSQGYLIKYAANQKSKLESESIEVLYESNSSMTANKYFVKISKYLYQDATIYSR